MMRHFDFRLARVSAAAVLVSAILIAAASAPAQPASTNKIIPVIVMDQVRLSDAIAALARNAGINYILDPRLSDSTQTVNGRWESTTAEKLLGAVAKDHGLKLIENPATSVTRIVSTNQVVSPVAVSHVGNATNDILPVISLDDVPLNEVIKKLAAQAHLQVTFDPALWKFGMMIPSVSVH
jgi:type II secretory pathway component GspD/PulD (secretin)